MNTILEKVQQVKTLAMQRINFMFLSYLQSAEASFFFSFEVTNHTIFRLHT